MYRCTPEHDYRKRRNKLLGRPDLPDLPDLALLRALGDPPPPTLPIPPNLIICQMCLSPVRLPVHLSARPPTTANHLNLEVNLE